MQRHRKGHVHGKYCCFYFWFCFFVMNWWMWLIPCFPNYILYFHVILSICIQYLTIKSWTCSSREIRRQALASVCLEEKVQNNQWVPHTSVTTLLDIYIHGLYLCDLLADQLSVLTLKWAICLISLGLHWWHHSPGGGREGRPSEGRRRARWHRWHHCEGEISQTSSGSDD